MQGLQGADCQGRRLTRLREARVERIVGSELDLRKRRGGGVDGDLVTRIWSGDLSPWVACGISI